jgi:hypothetical protein
MSSQVNPNLPTHLSLREALVQSYRSRVVGPAGAADEILDGMRPTENYIAGVLGPQNGEISAEEDDPLALNGEAEDGSVESTASAALSNSFKPSAFGFTCIVEEGCRELVGAVSAARYTHARDDPATDEGVGAAEAASVHPQSNRSLRFRRRTVDSGNFRIDLAKPNGEHRCTAGRYRVQWHLRPARGKQGARTLTVTVVNEDRVKPDSHSPEVGKHLFQVELSIRGEDGSPFLPRNLAGGDSAVEQDPQMVLLYRDQPAFATGHGCAAVWSPPVDSKVAWIRTESLPTFELPLVQSPDTGADVMSMRWLTQNSPDTVIAALERLCGEYDSWIGDRRTDALALPTNFQGAADENLTLCEQTAARMRAGVDRLRTDPAAWTAFQLMNRTIGQQFARPGSAPDPKWRTFQLAFILECLPGACSMGPTEDPVHVLWFPTGGGKTEAYLGLAAFSICYRRLRSRSSPGSGGVTALMRYTLRLLTVQQFQRAASMICALEAFRRSERTDLGEEEISIGLWVGEASTPNRLEEAFRQLKNPEGHGASPVQLSRCPLCQTPLDPSRDYLPSADRASLTIRCPSQTCVFRDRLPVYVVDEEIYRRCPTLLIGTVDKFARVPWVEETRSLFGLVGSWCRIHGYSSGGLCAVGGNRCAASQVDGLPPPSLIIQDELHLISGPLGTMVGVYEGLIDFLCRRTGSPPVIIGSSATVRRAGDQCRSLYGRPVAIFPPRALSPTNTFFSEEVSLTGRPGRLYIGILPAGFTVKTTLIRTYASLLIDRSGLLPGPWDGSDDGRRLRDPYWTLVAYFNSLRELGGAQRIIEDDVPAQMRVYNGGAGDPSPIDKVELTSRLKGSEIPGILARVETPLGGGVPPPDLLLATNMISVGVDVKRLSIMVVTGQPKATAEYIQATSRVGREYPGVVFTVYNWARPRDRSHMEDFLDYHATLYRHVEANSVTPFTDPALRRGLHAVVVSAVRILEPGMSGNADAGKFRKDLPTVLQLRDFLIRRLYDPRNDSEPTRLIAERFDSVVDAWAELVRDQGTQLTYSGQDSSLLVPIEAKTDQPTPGLPTLNSLREIEPSVGLRFEVS